jgi:hypothetical protein
MMKKNLQNFRLLMLLATASSVQLMASRGRMEEFKPTEPSTTSGRQQGLTTEQFNARKAAIESANPLSLSESSARQQVIARKISEQASNGGDVVGGNDQSLTIYNPDFALSQGDRMSTASNPASIQLADGQRTMFNRASIAANRLGTQLASAGRTAYNTTAKAGKTAYNAPGKAVQSVFGGDGQIITGETGSLRSAANATGSALATAGRTAYNAPGRAVQSVFGGDGQIITGETGSLKSAANTTGSALADGANTAIGNAAILGTKAYKAMPNVSGRLATARQQIRSSAETANEKSLVRDEQGNVIDVQQANRTYSNLPVRTLDSVLTSAKNVQNTVAGRLTTAKDTVMSWFSTNGKDPKELTADEAAAVKSEVDSASKTESSPQSTVSRMWDSMTSIFSRSKTEATPVAVEAEVVNPLTKSISEGFTPQAPDFTNSTVNSGFANFDETAA